MDRSLEWSSLFLYRRESPNLFEKGKNKEKIKPNDAIYIAPDEPHQFINDSEQTLKIICLIPKGKQNYLK